MENSVETGLKPVDFRVGWHVSLSDIGIAKPVESLVFPMFQHCFPPVECQDVTLPFPHIPPVEKVLERREYQEFQRFRGANVRK